MHSPARPRQGSTLRPSRTAPMCEDCIRILAMVQIGLARCHGQAACPARCYSLRHQRDVDWISCGTSSTKLPGERRARSANALATVDAIT